MISLSEITAATGLNLKQSAYSDEQVDIDRVIICSTTEDLPPDLSGGLVLTTCTPFHSGSDDWSQFIALAKGRKASAIGIGLCTESHSFNADLDIVDWQSKTKTLRDVAKDVEDEISRAGLRLYRRMVSLQNSLIDAVTSDDPTDSVIRRLGRLLNGSVILYRADGVVLSVTGEAPTSAVWSSINADSRTLQRFKSGRWHVVASPTTSVRSSKRWIAVASLDRATSEQVSGPLTKTAEQLLDVIELTRAGAAAEEQVRRAGLLNQLIMNREHHSISWQRMTPFGFEPHSVVWVALLSHDRWQSKSMATDRMDLELDELLQRVRRRALDHSCATLTTRVGNAIALLAEGPATFLSGWLDDLSKFGPPLHAGVGRRVSSLADVSDSFQDARLALNEIILHPPANGGRVLDFDDFSVTDVAISTAANSQLLRHSHALLAPLQGQPLLQEALATYFAKELNVAATAKALYVHPNSVRYRLSRIELLLGVELRDVAAIVDIYLATRLLERREGAAPSPSQPTDEIA